MLQHNADKESNKSNKEQIDTITEKNKNKEAQEGSRSNKYNVDYLRKKEINTIINKCNKNKPMRFAMQV